MRRETAFAIWAHRDPAMVERLVRSLDGHPVILHIDATADQDQFSHIRGVRFVRDRVDVRWGGFSEVETIVRLYRDALDELRGVDEASIVLMSGSDFPVRPLGEFTDYLEGCGFSEHIRAVPVLDGTPYMERKVRRRHFFDALPTGAPAPWRRRGRAAARRALALGLPRRSALTFGSLDPQWGSTWTVLSKACVEDLLPQALDPRTQRLFRHTQCPAEMLFPTLVHSGTWAERTEFGGPEERRGRWPGEFANVHYIHPSLGVWLDGSHAAETVASGGYFARKLRATDLDEYLDAVAAERAVRPGPSTPDRTPQPGLPPAPRR